MFQTFTLLHNGYHTTLNSSVPLHVPTPPPTMQEVMANDDVMGGWGDSVVEHDDLTEVAQRARLMLRSSVDVRYFHRYHALKSLSNPKQIYGKRARGRGVTLGWALEHKLKLKWSFGYEMATLLSPVPAFKNGVFIQKAVYSYGEDDYDLDGYPEALTVAELQLTHFKLIQLVAWKKIKSLAVLACEYRTETAPLSRVRPSESATRPPKRHKTGSSSLLDILGDYSPGGSACDGPTTTSGT